MVGPPPGLQAWGMVAGPRGRCRAQLPASQVHMGEGVVILATALLRCIHTAPPAPPGFWLLSALGLAGTLSALP